MDTRERLKCFQSDIDRFRSQIHGTFVH